MKIELHPVTQEVFWDKINDEYEQINLYQSKDNDTDVLAYRLKVMAYLRDALHVLPIPDELIAMACDREDVLGQVYDIWVDHAAKGEDLIDCVSLAYESAKEWLDSVRYEYRHNLLMERVAENNNVFIEKMRNAPLDVIISYATKISCYEDILLAMEDEVLPIQDIDALLTFPDPLQSIYDELSSIDFSHYMQIFVDVASNIAQYRHKNVIEGHFSESLATMDRENVEYFLNQYGSDPSDNEHAEYDLTQ